MIRKIVKPDNTSVTFEVPQRYVGKQIEVIAFESEKPDAENRAGKKKLSFEAVSIDTRGYQFNRDEAHG